MYDIENYYNAKSVSEAIALLTEHPDARIISGGSDVLIKIREGKMAGSSLVSIRDIEEIKGVEKKDSGDIYIGAGTVFSHITADPVIQECIPVLGEAVDQVGGPQIRNIGTIGGNICNGYHGHYIKYSMRNAMDIATLSCSVVSRIDSAKNILEDVRITFGVAAPVPYRCVETEELLKGQKPGEELYQKLEDSIRKEIHPRDSWRASRDFRLQIGGEIARRALIQTVKLAGVPAKDQGGEEA